MRDESLKNIGRELSGTPTSQPSSVRQESMLFVEVSPARMSRWQAPEQDLAGSDQLFGPNSSGSFAKLGPDGSWLKMYRGYSQAMVDGSWETFSETWPASGSMRSGECCPRPEWELRTSEDESSYWRTPTAQEAGARVETLFTKSGQPARPGQRAYRKTPSGKMVLQSVTIGQQVKMWSTPRANKIGGYSSPDFSPTLEQAVKFPTPTVQDAENNGGPSQFKRNTLPLNAMVKRWPTPSSNNGTGGATGLAGGSGNRKKLYMMLGKEEGKKLGCQSLNPYWVEWLMGFPLGWTALDALVTPSSRKSRKRSAK